jgi:hypothetical protein
MNKIESLQDRWTRCNQAIHLLMKSNQPSTDCVPRGKSHVALSHSHLTRWKEKVPLKPSEMGKRLRILHCYVPTMIVCLFVPLSACFWHFRTFSCVPPICSQKETKRRNSPQSKRCCLTYELSGGDAECNMMGTHRLAALRWHPDEAENDILGAIHPQKAGNLDDVEAINSGMLHRSPFMEPPSCWCKLKNDLVQTHTAMPPLLSPQTKLYRNFSGPHTSYPTDSI